MSEVTEKKKILSLDYIKLAKWIYVEENGDSLFEGSWLLINGPLFVPVSYFKDEIVEEYKMKDKNLFRFTAIARINEGTLEVDQFILHAWSGNWGCGYDEETIRPWREFTKYISKHTDPSDFLKTMPDIKIKDIELIAPIKDTQEG